jgi:hypothetical protein
MNRRYFIASLASINALPLLARQSIRLTVWSERSEPVEIYPNGINGAIAETLNCGKGISAMC